jgi:N-acetyl-anhydromuramoyl-L-alanine amidase
MPFTLPRPGPSQETLSQAAGWTAGGVLSRARQVPSPNHDTRPEGVLVNLLVIHGISLPPGEFGGAAVERLFTNRLDPRGHAAFAPLEGLRVSAHFFIRRGGSLIQFVPCDRRAWHAGVSVWRGQERCNDFSIGVELEGADDCPYAAAQYRQLARLVRDLMGRYPLAECVGHSDIAPGRKTDPGSAFDWAALQARLGFPAV